VRGGSNNSPRPRTPSEIARELHALLTNAGLDGAYVLVGPSLCGKNVRLFAHLTWLSPSVKVRKDE
jgi:hypothetical protein